MKLLIGVVVALLCMQTIQASFLRFDNQCQRDLRARKTSVSRWFRQTFKPEHDIAHDKLNIIKEVCDQLTKALQAYSATTPTAAQIAEFFTAFFQLQLKAVKAITELWYYVDLLVSISGEQKCSVQQACVTSSTFSGCEAEINIEVCDLLGFHQGIVDAAAQVKILLAALLQSCTDLYEQARSADCRNRASNNGNRCGCGAGQSGSTDVVSYFVNDFLPSFISRHDIAHTELNGIDEICKLLTKIIDDWINRK